MRSPMDRMCRCARTASQRSGAASCSTYAGGAGETVDAHEVLFMLYIESDVFYGASVSERRCL